MIRRCVEKFLFVLLMVIGRLLCAPRFGRQTTARPTSAACTASRCRGGGVIRLNFVGRLCQTPITRPGVAQNGVARPSDIDGHARTPSEREGRSKRPTIISALRRYTIR